MKRWLLVLMSSCAASTPPPKISFAEAMADAPEAGSTVKKPAPFDPKASAALADELLAFKQEAARLRDNTPRGAPMPFAHVAAWSRVLVAVDSHLGQPNETFSVLDGVRARLQLEDAMNADGQAYGDIDSEVAEHAQRTIRGLALKVSLLTTGRRPRLSSPFAWPLWPVQLTSPFGERTHPLLGETKMHNGIDLLAYRSQPVTAAADGTVLYSGWAGGYGRQVEVLHDEHFSTTYNHLETLMVETGAEVKKGQLVGLAGKSGKVTGVHLHFEIHRDGEPVDPMTLMPSPEPPEPDTVAGR